jgi:hypothetical protein
MNFCNFDCADINIAKYFARCLFVDKLANSGL